MIEWLHIIHKHSLKLSAFTLLLSVFFIQQITERGEGQVKSMAALFQLLAIYSLLFKYWLVLVRVPLYKSQAGEGVKLSTLGNVTSQHVHVEYVCVRCAYMVSSHWLSLISRVPISLLPTDSGQWAAKPLLTRKWVFRSEVGIFRSMKNTDDSDFCFKSCFTWSLYYLYVPDLKIVHL